MTTSTWRRVAPTVATIAEWSDTNLLALGDWQDSAQRRQSRAKMALHYSSARYFLSVRKKHEILEMLGRRGVFATWDEVSKEVLDDIAVNVLKQVEGAVQKDKLLSTPRTCDRVFRWPLLPSPEFGMSVMRCFRAWLGRS